MPVIRDKDGNIIEEKTTLNDETRSVGAQTNIPTEKSINAYKPGVAAGDPNPGNPYEAKTVLAGSVRRKVQENAASAEDNRTRVYRPGKAVTEAADLPKENADPMSDPPVGWLIVVKGAGKGSVLTIGNGANSIGRDESERISVDFGDGMISRSGHSVVTYDPRGRKFYIQNGSGTNLTYMNDAPVLTTQELEPMTHIQVGETTLRFVPLCGDKFDWQETEGE